MLNDTELRNPWRSMKTQRTMSMTVEAWEKLGNLAMRAPPAALRYWKS